MSARSQCLGSALWGSACEWEEEFQTLSCHDWFVFWVRSLDSDLTVLPVPPIQDPAPVLSSLPPADVSTFLAFPSPEKLLRLGPKSSMLIAQQVSVRCRACHSRAARERDEPRRTGVGLSAGGACQGSFHTRPFHT